MSRTSNGLRQSDCWVTIRRLTGRKPHQAANNASDQGNCCCYRDDPASPHPRARRRRGHWRNG